MKLLIEMMIWVWVEKKLLRLRIELDFLEQIIDDEQLWLLQLNVDHGGSQLSRRWSQLAEQ